MFVNLHTLPAGKSMYTVGVTGDPAETAPDDMGYDEVDVVTSSRASAREVLDAARHVLRRDYEGCRVIGVINQSDGYVMIERPNGDLLTDDDF